MTRPFRNPHLKTGFTLVEMVIVLTIIGLIAGSIVVIRDMVRNAQVQSVINDEDRYKKALQLFKEKYNYLPGDMPTASNFWGAEASCPTAYSPGEAVPKTVTCNGDGNGRIDTFAEGIRAWQQLANAGFIEGEYSGIQGNANANSIVAGTDVPASKVPNCGWIIGYAPASSAGAFTTNSGTRLVLVGSGPDEFYPGCLTPVETYGIDAKIDDGIATSGNDQEGSLTFLFPGLLFSHWACLSPDWQYNTSLSDTLCIPVFNTGL